MAKDAYWFSHDSNARSDPKILALIGKYGCEGYGRYWIIIESLREQEQYKLPHKQYISNALAMQMQCTNIATMDFIMDCISEYELLQSDGEFFWSNSLLKRMQALEVSREKKTEKARKAAEKRWNKCTSNADAMQGQCETMPSKVKKSKEKDSKEDKNKLLEYTSNDGLIEAIKGFIEMRRSIKKPLTDRALSMMLKELDALAKNDTDKIAILNQSTMNCWQGIFEIKQSRSQATYNKPTNAVEDFFGGGHGTATRGTFPGTAEESETTTTIDVGFSFSED